MYEITQWTRFELELTDAGPVSQPIQKFCPTDNNDRVLWIGTE